MDNQKTDILESKKPKANVKVELIQQTDLTIEGEKIWYKILIDGSYVMSSLTDKKFEAIRLYERIIKNGGLVQENTIVSSAVIEKEVSNAK